MTCIAGLVDDGAVHIACDSAGVDGNWNLRTRADAKVFRVGNVAFGFTTSFRMGQLLRYRLKLSEPPTGEALHRWMATDFVDAVRSCLKDGGFATKSSEAENGGTFLVGVAGRLFTVENDYQVAETSEPFAAVGCGAPYALGALAVLKGDGRERAMQAVAVAERFSAGVRGPFACITLPRTA